MSSTDGMKSTDRVRETCGKCGGSGSVPWGLPADVLVDERIVGKYCFACNGRGYREVLVISIRSRERRVARLAAEAEKKMAEAAVARTDRFEAFTASNPDVVAFLTSEESRVADWLARYCNELDADGALCEKSLTQIKKVLAAKAREVDVIEGRYVVDGVLKGWKETWNDWGSCIKITVRVTVPAGDDVEGGEYTVYGTAPRGLDYEAVGDVVRFKATVKKSDRDPSFGFFSRPINMENAE